MQERNRRASVPLTCAATLAARTQQKETLMAMTRIGLIAAAAMLAAGMGVAAAQTSSTTTPGATSNQGKCWDSATNQVRDKSSTSGSTGSTTSGSTAMSGSSSATGSSGSTAQTRPPGMPSC